MPTALIWTALTLTVMLNGVEVGALINTGCGRILVKWAKGPYTPEVLRMQCIHGDVREYCTKMVTIGTGSQTFTCQVGMVSRLDCGVLIGRDCPILAQLLQRTQPPGRPSVPRFQGDPAKATMAELPMQRPDLAPLT